MAGLKYVGADYGKDDNTNDLLTKGDVDAAFANASVSQTAVKSVINTAVANMASQSAVNLALSAYIESNYLANAVENLIPLADVGIAEGVVPLNLSGLGVAPLDSTGVIPAQFVPSLGAGYCLGPFGPTQTTSVTAGAQPVKICDWGINWGSAVGPGFAFQPLVFMSLLAGAINGGRPVIEVRMSDGLDTYADQTLIARGVGRSCWNDLQTINVLSAPAGSGHTGVAGTGYPATYSAWLSAWLYDANAQTVTVDTGNIVNAGVFFIRYQQ